jgi:hypothetical protein
MQIYQALKYETTPFKKKKVVVHKAELEKKESHYLRTFNSG